MKKISLSKFENLKQYKWQFLGSAAFVLLLVIDAVHCSEIEALKAKAAEEKTSAPVYVYDVKKIVSDSSELNALQQKYAKQLNELNKQVAEAQKKLEKMKDKKAKAEFSDVYLSTLNLKRDTLFEEYEKAINDLSDRTNTALLKVVEEKGAPVVYDVKAIAVTTPNVIDITGEVLQELQK